MSNFSTAIEAKARHLFVMSVCEKISNGAYSELRSRDECEIAAGAWWDYGNASEENYTTFRTRAANEIIWGSTLSEFTSQIEEYVKKQTEEVTPKTVESSVMYDRFSTKPLNDSTPRVLAYA